jgi:hypothetical protein
VLPDFLATGELMDMCSVESHRFVCAPAASITRGGHAFALLSLGLALLPLPANSGENPTDKPGQAWPITVQARYRLRFNGIEVGRLNINSSATATTYSLSGSAKISVLFGAFKWSGSSKVSGAIEGGTPAPATYAFDWRQNKKAGTIGIGFKDHAAAEIAITPSPRVRPDSVPLTQAHKTGAFDPMSAILMLTKADGRPPCDRRVGIFDGKQRYDIVFTPKRVTRLPPPSGGGPAETAHVCRIMYEPVAGHRANADTTAYASNRDAEIVLRRIPGSEMLIPYSATIPSAWGTGSMVTERIDIVTAAAGKIAFTD